MNGAAGAWICLGLFFLAKAGIEIAHAIESMGCPTP